MNGFEVTKLTAGYGEKNILDGISFSVAYGKLAGILGANGSGKTTLLKSICGILPHSGTCVLNGEPLDGLSARKMAARCSYIPQRSGVSLDISAFDVVLMGFNAKLGLLEHPNRWMRERALAMLERVGLAGMEEKNYLHLSEGQKQLCILARTLVAECELLVMDEPESALDFRFRYKMLEIVQRHIKENCCIGLVSLHDPSLALNCCDQLLLLENGRCMDVLHPKVDSADRMEQALTRLYGPLSLVSCQDRMGRAHLVMLKEREEET